MVCVATASQEYSNKQTRSQSPAGEGLLARSLAPRAARAPLPTTAVLVSMRLGPIAAAVLLLASYTSCVAVAGLPIAREHVAANGGSPSVPRPPSSARYLPWHSACHVGATSASTALLLAAGGPPEVAR